jgi:hypothetical protein
MSLFSTVVTVAAPDVEPYQGWTPCIHWCKSNCRGFWAYDGEGAFKFQSESDATLFLLKWTNT